MEMEDEEGLIRSIWCKEDLHRLTNSSTGSGIVETSDDACTEHLRAFGLWITIMTVMYINM